MAAQPPRDREVVVTNGGGGGGSGMAIAIVLVVIVLIVAGFLLLGGDGTTGESDGSDIEIEEPNVEPPDVDVEIQEDGSDSGGNGEREADQALL